MESKKNHKCPQCNGIGWVWVKAPDKTLLRTVCLICDNLGYVDEICIRKYEDEEDNDK